MYERSLAIYEYLDRTSSTYSFERRRKIEEVKNNCLMSDQQNNGSSCKK